MSKESLGCLIILTLSFCGCKRESSILVPSIADQIHITFLVYHSGDYPHPTCKFKISNESDHNIASNTNEIVYLIIDPLGNPWIGREGVAKFDGTKWTAYQSTNSGLPSDNIRDLEFDQYGNLWIATEWGLAVFRAGGVVTEIEEMPDARPLPQDFYLAQNFPNPFNPFNPSTEISFSVSKPLHVSIIICNVRGQLVRELVDNDFTPNVYHVQWDGTNSANVLVPSGVYFYRITTRAGVMTKKLILLK